MSFSSLSPKKVADYKEDGLTDEQIEKLNKREEKRIVEKLKAMTLNVLDQQEDRQEIRLVLLGKTGAGKSATGNLILGRQEFEESSRAVSCTATIQEGHADVDGMHVRVIDTPGFYDTAKTPAEIVAEVVKVMDTFNEGIHGFLFVFNAETYRFTEDQRKIFSMLEKGVFGPSFVNCCYIVITHGNGIQKNLVDYVRDQAGTPLGQIMNSTLSRRIIAVENSCEEEFFREGQRTQLFRFVASSTREMYTNDDLQQHRRETLDSVEASVRSLVPMIEVETFRKMQAMTQGEIKNMSESTKQRMTEEILDKLMEEMETATIPKDKLRQAVLQVFERKRDRLSGTDFLEKIKAFALPLLAVAGQVLPDIIQLIMQLKKKK